MLYTYLVFYYYTTAFKTESEVRDLLLPSACMHLYPQEVNNETLNFQLRS